jgi:hypothetical protein
VDNAMRMRAADRVNMAAIITLAVRQALPDHE